MAEKWIQKAFKSIKKRGTEGVCTGDKYGGPTCPPGSKRYNMAKTLRKMHQGGPAKHEKGAVGPGKSKLSKKEQKKQVSEWYKKARDILMSHKFYNRIPSYLQGEADINEKLSYGLSDMWYKTDDPRILSESRALGLKPVDLYNPPKKQQGGLLYGPSHEDGGMLAMVGGKEPIELEGKEYIIKAKSAEKLGKETLDEMNETGRIPTMAKGGKTKKKQAGGRVRAGYRPTAPIPSRVSFPKEVRMMGHGGEVSLSNDDAPAGDVHTTHSHSGYKIGE